MRLRYAILADAAQVFPDGKFSVFGGGIETLTAPGFPTLTPSLALVAQLLLEKSEVGQPHQMRVELLNPDGGSMFPSDLEKQFTPVENPKAVELGMPTTYLFVVTFASLVFPSEGKYQFRLFVDDKLIAELPVYLMAGQTSEQTSNRSEA